MTWKKVKNVIGARLVGEEHQQGRAKARKQCQNHSAASQSMPLQMEYYQEIGFEANGHPPAPPEEKRECRFSLGPKASAQGELSIV